MVSCELHHKAATRLLSNAGQSVGLLLLSRSTAHSSITLTNIQHVNVEVSVSVYRHLLPLRFLIQWVEKFVE